MTTALLELRNVDVAFKLGKQDYPALQQLNVQVGRREKVGIVGESGCGKSLTSLAIMGLLPGTARMTGGDIRLDSKPLAAAGQEWKLVRGKEIAMIFQNPMTALNPLMPAGKQIAEMALLHLDVSRKEAKELALEMMAKVGLSRVERLFGEYPHQLSGGMMQRMMIAMALICRPQLLIADEPTTALDVTIQAQILELLREMNSTTGTAMLFISHDLGVIREVCDRVIVMYAGYIVEEAPVEELLDQPRHPYTAGLLQSLPGADKRGRALYTIPGRVPPITGRKPGCPFAGRCPSAAAVCETAVPDMKRVSGRHLVRCHLVEDEEGSPA